ncbi:3-oxoacyl-[acyl-carrier-protein] synthase, KASIII [Fulvivirga imtechensis AK7]|uniref:3-oxoacyl-[acyl-carrier-protein] synthase, KASIII n=1 Tax=Fulvivirga imtechensis AK7 TaxID=1237149 RepID=L8JNK3_9BACT|nr:ketoacyl-ACP synthase III [Fulvivirga imtechensis]ELR70541.1 3-oxoacyl-[acyl-carrier-protein] synthase, KASIII [Fulvivirga imtechensis AK7]
MRKAIIRSTGAYVPEKVIPNSYFSELLREDVDGWLRENVNIYERRWCAENESVADLCQRASEQALQRAVLNASDLDLIIVATDTPEYISPSTAAVLQDRLGAVNAGTFDLNTACAGFVTAFDVAAKYITADERYNNILVLGGYAMSKHLNMSDKKTVTLFADGAGAVILSAENNSDNGFITSELKTKGEYNGWMGIYSGGSHEPVNADVISRMDHKLKFVHKFPKEINPVMWTEMTLKMCERLGITPDDIDQYLITQLNFNSIDETMDRLGVDRSKAHKIMKYYGYTGSACIPMALNDAIENGKIQRGDMLFLIGSGGGLAFACAAIKY